MRHEFVEFIPEELQEGIIYVSLEFSTAIHLCVCGCGNQVVTPFSPKDWTLRFNGESISLSPSIGNWEFKCQSHYWIIDDKVVHSRKWSRDEILKNRELSSGFTTKKSMKKNNWFIKKLLAFFY
ncbi:DUF6527 family protein [Owenweeksia hongkongensis]|uniref:DUF6527 family protein n=1 Tax=Owenweeksia hongkongensis TaxID=253245 RepID=UPI003A94542D